MTGDDALYLLLWLSLTVCCLLLPVALLLVGRKLMEQELQRAKGVDGTMHLQAAMNIRTYGMRVFVAITFGLFALLLLVDAPVIVRMWVNRLLFVLLPLSYLIVCCLDWRVYGQQLRIEIDEETQARANRRQKQLHEASSSAFVAGVKDAEGKAEVKAEGVATQARETTRVAVLQASADAETTPVDVATIAPAAAQSIADAVTPQAAQSALEAIADAMPDQRR